MNKIYTILLGVLFFSALTFTAPRAYADCQQIYGGGQVCNNTFSFSIEKLVQTPTNGNYVNNLSINDPKFSPSQNVNFKITVKNTGNSTISSINVSDTFPQFLNFVSGPGSFDSNTKKLTFTVNNLNSGDSQSFNVTGKIADSNLMPSDQGTICMVNQAIGTDNNGVSNSSTSQFCAQKNVLGAGETQVFAAPSIVSTPATGPEMLPLLSLIPGGLAGFILRKRTINK